MKFKTMDKTCAVRVAFACAMATVTLCGAGSALAETVTLKGKGTYFVDRKLMPLANGGAVLQTTNTTVASVEPGDAGVMFGECAGLAHVTPDSQFRSRLYCNFTDNGKDVFVVQLDLGGSDPGVKVIGGSGRWTDATGTGTVTPSGEDDAQGRYSYEFKITTP